MLSIVIPAGGGLARLKCTLTCLEGAVRSEGTECEIFVVNDGCAPEVSEHVRSLSAQSPVDFQLVEIPRSGRSVARNAGAWRARGRRILFMDSDVLLEREALRFHASLGGRDTWVIYRGTIAHLPWLAALEDPVNGGLTAEAKRSLRGSADGASLLASRRLTPEVIENPALLRAHARSTPFQRDLAQWFRNNSEDSDASWIGCTGGQVSVDRTVFEALEGFDEAMGLKWGAEDLEFGYRAVQSGAVIRHAEEAICYHMDHSVSGRAGDHDWALNYFAGKHGNEAVLRLGDYFLGRCSLPDVLEACHAEA